MRYVYLFGALLMAAIVGGLTKQILDTMTTAGPPAGIIYYATQLADNNTYSGVSFGGAFELLFFQALPWILPAAWVVWVFLKMGKGGTQE